jgi:DNA (cytosine-5)-methyltransferase 1
MYGGAKGVDVVVGGPPCQGFSVAGKCRETDARNELFKDYLNAIQLLTPKYFVMENVPGLATMYQGKTVNEFYQRVKEMSPVRYGVVGPIRINAANFGVPQLRERIIFIGNREDVYPISEIAPIHRGSPVKVKEALGDLAFLRAWERTDSYSDEHPPTTNYQIDSRRGRLFAKMGIREEGILRNHEAARHSPGVIARFTMMEPGRSFESVPRELWNMHLNSAKRRCVRLHPNRPSFTVVTLPEDFVHYLHPRILTVREMARLQSFDDTFQFFGPRASGGGGQGNNRRTLDLPQYSQVANAIPPLVAKAIADVVLTALQQQTKVRTISIGENLIPASEGRQLKLINYDRYC